MTSIGDAKSGEVNTIVAATMAFAGKDLRAGCRRKGTAIQSKEREVIKSIVELCDQEAKQKSLLCPIRQATKRAAIYAKVSERTIKRIREQIKLGIDYPDCESSIRARKSKMNLKFACNLSFLFTEAPLIISRYLLAKQAGFKAVESGFPYGFTVSEVLEAKTEANVEQVLINIYTGDVTKGELGFAAVPGKEEEFRKSVDITLEYAKALNCKKIHIMSGKVENPNEENDRVYEENLRYAVGKFQDHGILGLIEPINNFTVPNYYLNNFEKGLKIVKKIDSPNLRLMLDVFHLQNVQGSITRTIQENLPYIGHIQVAQVPHRNEPESPGEIDYKYVFSLLEKEGYDDYIGLEYKPTSNSMESLKWIKRSGYTL